MLDHGLRHRAPPAVVAVAPVAVFPVSVPIFLPIASRDLGAMSFVVFDHPADIVPGGRFVQLEDEIDVSHVYLRTAWMNLNKGTRSIGSRLQTISTASAPTQLPIKHTSSGEMPR